MANENNDSRVALFITTVRTEVLVVDGETAGMCIHQKAGHIEVFTTIQHIGDLVVIHNNATGERFDSSRREADAVLWSAATNVVLNRDRARALAA